MKQVFITGRKKSLIKEVTTPKAKEEWVLVKIISAPMCTEFKQYASGEADFSLGHEASGQVVEVSNSNKLKSGDRVVVMPQYPCGKCELCLSGEYIHCENNCNFTAINGTPYGSATFAQYILKPSWLLPTIPEDISYDHAGMLCCALGPTFGAMEKMQVQAGETVLIAGLGPVGLGGVINGLHRGARIIGITKNKYRTELALKLGAEKVLDPEDYKILDNILKLTEGRGTDTSIDCTGNSEAQTLLINAVKRTGRVAFVGESEHLKIDVSRQLLRKGLKLFGIWHYNLKDIPKLFEIVKKSKELIDELITHKFPIAQVKDAWELQLSGNCGKIIIHPWD